MATQQSTRLTVVTMHDGPLAGKSFTPTGEFRCPKRGDYYYDAGAGGICLCCRRSMPMARDIFTGPPSRR
jgi:hypothetical protein